MPQDETVSQHDLPYCDVPVWAVPAFDEGTARRMFKGGRWGRLRSACRRLLLPLRPAPPAVEAGGIATELPTLALVWLPFFHVSLDLPDRSRMALQHRGSLEERPADTDAARLRVFVDGYEPTVGWDDLAKVSWQAGPLSRPFPPGQSAEEAARLATQFVVRWQLQSGGRNAALQRELRVVEMRLVHCPYWAYYFQRRPGILDVRLLDALRGQLAGPRVKASLLAALATRAAVPATQ